MKLKRSERRETATCSFFNKLGKTTALLFLKYILSIFYVVNYYFEAGDRVIIATKQVSILVTHDNTSLGNTCLCSYNITADCRDNQQLQMQSGFDERIFVFTQLLHNRCGIARRFLRMRTIAASCMAGGDVRYG